LLRGHHDPDQISSIEWKKTSGPDQYSIMNRYVGLYCVSNLTEGFYQFEVTVTDKFGRFARDTMTLTVRSDKNIYTNQEILFKDPIWSCPWGCTAELNNITSLIPAGKPFKVYVKATSANEWAIVVPADIYSKHPAEYLYENYYSIGNNTMFLYNDTESVSAGGMIKIVY